MDWNGFDSLLKNLILSFVIDTRTVGTVYETVVKPRLTSVCWEWYEIITSEYFSKLIGTSLFLGRGIPSYPFVIVDTPLSILGAWGEVLIFEYFVQRPSGEKINARVILMTEHYILLLIKNEYYFFKDTLDEPINAPSFLFEIQTSFMKMVETDWGIIIALDDEDSVQCVQFSSDLKEMKDLFTGDAGTIPLRCGILDPKNRIWRPWNDLSASFHVPEEFDVSGKFFRSSMDFHFKNGKLSCYDFVKGKILWERVIDGKKIPFSSCGFIVAGSEVIDSMTGSRLYSNDERNVEFITKEGDFQYTIWLRFSSIRN